MYGGEKGWMDGNSKYFDNHLAIDLEQWRISGVEMKTCDNILASDWLFYTNRRNYSYIQK